MGPNQVGSTDGLSDERPGGQNSPLLFVYCNLTSSSFMAGADRALIALRYVSVEIQRKSAPSQERSKWQRCMSEMLHDSNRENENNEDSLQNKLTTPTTKNRR
jgi:hypothetical protein